MTPSNLDDTIAALGSAPGGAARGIIRISGEATQDILTKIFQPENLARWNQAQQAGTHAGTISLSDSSPAIVLSVHVLYWHTQRSFTGQQAAEIHMAGSPPLLEAVLHLLFREGVRPANRGEFTLRAFLSGRIDLVQAEGVLGVIDSRDDAELNSALNQLAGGISSQLQELRELLLVDRADLEAGLDFVEEDIDFVHRTEFIERLADANGFVQKLLKQTTTRMTSNVVPKVVLAGLPNAGKSRLFNSLVGDERAIVSHQQGTTRDYLTATVRWNNFAMELIDTAGWESTSVSEKILSMPAKEMAPQEMVPMETAQLLRGQQTEEADLILWCTASDMQHQETILNDELMRSLPGGISKLFLLTKSDLQKQLQKQLQQFSVKTNSVLVSAKDENMIKTLKEKIVAFFSEQHSQDDSLLGTTAARCQNALEQTGRSLQAARELATSQAGDELISLELATAIDHLGEITGAVYTDDLLDRIFSRFCIGK